MDLKRSVVAEASLDKQNCTYIRHQKDLIVSKHPVLVGLVFEQILGVSLGG